MILQHFQTPQTTENNPPPDIAVDVQKTICFLNEDSPFKTGPFSSDLALVAWMNAQHAAGKIVMPVSFFVSAGILKILGTIGLYPEIVKNLTHKENLEERRLGIYIDDDPPEKLKSRAKKYYHPHDPELRDRIRQLAPNCIKQAGPAPA